MPQGRDEQGKGQDRSEYDHPGHQRPDGQVDAVEVPEERLSTFPVGGSVRVWPQARPDARFAARVVTIKPRAEFATRKNWGLQSRDLKTFSVRLAPQNATVISGQTFVVEAGRN